MTMKKWSEEAWAAAAPIYERILQLPFVSALADGTLPHDRFMFYLCQDALYINNYARVLAHIASRLTDSDQVADFLRFGMDGVEVERIMHDSYLKSRCLTPSEMSPTCLLYCSLLSAQATAPVEVEAAAVLPCFWVYWKAGLEIMERAAADNPYRKWIDTYADPAFEISTRRAIEICDNLAEKAGEDTRRRMTEIFVQCTRMEWLFWDSAWNLEAWKI